jgi:hypothetical protein
MIILKSNLKSTIYFKLIIQLYKLKIIIIFIRIKPEFIHKLYKNYASKSPRNDMMNAARVYKKFFKMF